MDEQLAAALADPRMREAMIAQLGGASSPNQRVGEAFEDVSGMVAPGNLDLGNSRTNSVGWSASRCRSRPRRNSFRPKVRSAFLGASFTIVLFANGGDNPIGHALARSRLRCGRPPLHRRQPNNANRA